MQQPKAQRISYIPWDFNYHAKQRSSFILADMASVIKTGLDATSFFFMCPGDDTRDHQVTAHSSIKQSLKQFQRHCKQNPVSTMMPHASLHVPMTLPATTAVLGFYRCLQQRLPLC